MSRDVLVDVVIPARNASLALPGLWSALPHRQLRSIVVVDRGSVDQTAAVARDLGAVVTREPHGGYGAACLRARAHFEQLPVPPDVVVFLPAECAAAAASLPALLEPLITRGVELVTALDTGATTRLTVPSALARIMGTMYRDQVGAYAPVRAIRFPAWVALGMAEHGQAWDIEMLVRALKLGLTRETVTISGAGNATPVSLRGVVHVLRHSTMR